MTTTSLMVVDSLLRITAANQATATRVPMFYGDDYNTSTTADHPLLRRPHCGA